MNCEIAWNLIVNCIFLNVSDGLYFSIKGGFKFSQGSFIASNSTSFSWSLYPRSDYPKAADTRHDLSVYL
jgi:hypothetical protein